MLFPNLNLPSLNKVFIKNSFAFFSSISLDHVVRALEQVASTNRTISLIERYQNLVIEIFFEE